MQVHQSNRKCYQNCCVCINVKNKQNNHGSIHKTEQNIMGHDTCTLRYVDRVTIFII